MITALSEWPRNEYLKQFVNVRADFSEDGKVVPRAIIWTDGQEYPIDKIKDVRSAPALKAGGIGDRYTVEICGQDRFLFFEHNPDCCSAQLGRWFVEVKNREN